MSVQLKKHLISVKDYYLMAEVGILDGESKVELLRGEIIHMSPIGSQHALCVNKLNAHLLPLLQTSTFLSIQNPVQLGDYSQPEPDILLVKGQMEDYADRHPRAQDILLLIEVSDTTLEKDRLIKLPIYAEAGIPEVWIMNLPENQIEVYSLPQGQTYRQQSSYSGKTPIPIPGLTQTVFADSLLP
ncbi:MAG: Uma2 family endonuclease [Bacteroidota bacterium]